MDEKDCRRNGKDGYVHCFNSRDKQFIRKEIEIVLRRYTLEKVQIHEYGRHHVIEEKVIRSNGTYQKVTKEWQDIKLRQRLYFFLVTFQR